jgi:hypothetical protein
MWSRNLRSNRYQRPLSWLTFALLAAGALPGCTVGPAWKKQSMWSPASWFAANHTAAAVASPISTPVPEPIDPNWWNIFNDRELTSGWRRPT